MNPFDQVERLSKLYWPALMLLIDGQRTIALSPVLMIVGINFINISSATYIWHAEVEAANSAAVGLTYSTCMLH